jgi:SP family general alpha glucoside:H+ symporter-like MFS transporter
MASRHSSIDNAHNATQNEAKDKVEEAGGPLHFPAADELQKSNAMVDITLGAKSASDKEHKMTLMQGIRLYPKAVIFSFIISTCIAMEGYDVCLVNNFYAFPPFNRKYGVLGDDGTYQIPARWQAGLSNGAQCGEIIGLFINGWVSERFGYRYVSATTAKM